MISSQRNFPIGIFQPIIPIFTNGVMLPAHKSVVHTSVMLGGFRHNYFFNVGVSVMFGSFRHTLTPYFLIVEIYQTRLYYS